MCLLWLGNERASFKPKSRVTSRAAAADECGKGTVVGNWDMLGKELFLPLCFSLLSSLVGFLCPPPPILLHFHSLVTRFFLCPKQFGGEVHLFMWDWS